MPVDAGLGIVFAAIVAFAVKFVEPSKFSARHEAFHHQENGSHSKLLTWFKDVQDTAQDYDAAHFKTRHEE
jgi:hypothetical protein